MIRKRDSKLLRHELKHKEPVHHHETRDTTRCQNAILNSLATSSNNLFQQTLFCINNTPRGHFQV
jgi:hypothetical protein